MSNPFYDASAIERLLRTMNPTNPRAALEGIAWANYDAAAAFYHVTPAILLQDVLRRGIRAKRAAMKRADVGAAYFFSPDTSGNIADVAGAVAYTLSMGWMQRGLLAIKRAYVVLEIDREGISHSKVHWDNVGEAYALASFAHVGDIRANHIRLLQTRPIPDDWLHYDASQATPGVEGYNARLQARR